MEGVTRISFEYVTAGMRSARTIINWAEVGRYLCGVDVADSRFKTFRKDRITSYADGAEALLSDPKPPPPALPKRVEDDRQHIIFTGFPKVQRTNLEDRAREADLRVCSTVTKSCMYLVAGPRAGRTKVERARELSAYILTEPQFHALLETGELPDDADDLLTDC